MDRNIINESKKSLKLIENRFIIDLNDKLGTGSYGDVFRCNKFMLIAYDKTDP